MGAAAEDVLVFTAAASCPEQAWKRLAGESSAWVLLANANDVDSLRSTRADLQFVSGLGDVPYVVATYMSMAGEELSPKQIAKALGLDAGTRCCVPAARPRVGRGVVRAALELAAGAPRRRRAAARPPAPVQRRRPLVIAAPRREDLAQAGRARARAKKGHHRMYYPSYRMRRLRRTPAIRDLVRETKLQLDDLVYPLFVIAGENVKNPISSMPGCFQLSIGNLLPEVREVVELGIKASCSSASPPTRTPPPPAPTTPRASCRWPSAPSRTSSRTSWSSPTSASASTPTTATAAWSRRARWSTT